MTVVVVVVGLGNGKNGDCGGVYSDSSGDGYIILLDVVVIVVIVVVIVIVVVEAAVVVVVTAVAVKINIT